MSPTIKLAFKIALFSVALIGVALLTDAWRSARHDSQRLAVALAVQNNAVQQAADREKQRDSQLSGTLAQIQSQKRAVRTPQQAAAQLASALPPLPLPISIHIPNLSLPPAPGEAPREAPDATINIPTPDLVPLFDGLQDCRSSEAQSDTLQKDLADEKTHSAALQQERDAALAVARGGTILLRLKRAAKWFAIGVAAGAAVAAVARR